MNTERNILHPGICGGTAHIVIVYEGPIEDPLTRKRWYVECECGIDRTPVRNYVSEAIMEWNDTHPLRRDGQ